MAQVTFDAPAAYVRLALRIFFTVTLILIGFIGDQCCAMRVRVKIARKDKVAIPQMTGWLSGFGAAQAFWCLRTAPAGWLGYLMLITSLLWLASDLAVSGLVVTVQVPARCPFNTEGPISVFTVKHPFVYRNLYNAGPGYDLISQAQTASVRNGGLDGIYVKVNSDSNFRADPKDILGQWSCRDTGVIPPTFDEYVWPNDIMAELSSSGFLFSKTNYSCFEENTVDGVDLTNNVVLLSASQPEYPSAPWNVRAAIDTTLPQNQTKTFNLYECSMEAPSVDWLLAQVNPYVAFAGWCEKIQTYIFNGAGMIDNPSEVIASSLNNIMTNAGGSWNDTSEPIIIEDPTQGCLAPRALVSWPVFLLFGMVSIIFLGIICYAVLLAAELHFSVRPSLSPSASSTPHSGRSQPEQIPPAGLLTWIGRAVQQTPQGRNASLRSLKNWFFLSGPSADFVILPGQAGQDLEKSVDSRLPVSEHASRLPIQQVVVQDLESNEDNKMLTGKDSGASQPTEVEVRVEEVEGGNNRTDITGGCTDQTAGFHNINLQDRRGG